MYAFVRFCHGHSLNELTFDPLRVSGVSHPRKSSRCWVPLPIVPMTENVNIGSITQFDLYHRFVYFWLWRNIKEMRFAAKNIAWNIFRLAGLYNGCCSASDILITRHFNPSGLNVNNVAIPTNIFKIKEMTLISYCEWKKERLFGVGCWR
jgi:hypothetical protein